jgi:predicted Zn-dependent protease
MVSRRFDGGAMKRLFDAVLVAVLALSLAVPAAFARPRQTNTQTQQPQTSSTDSTQQPQTQDQQQPSSSDQDQTPKGVKPGSEKDINSVGNRSVGKGVNLYSLEREIALGKGAAQEVERSAKMITDPVVTEYVNREIGRAHV